MNRVQYPPVYAGLYVLLIVAVSAVMTAQMPGAASLAGILFWTLFYGGGLACGWKYNQNGSGVLKNVTNVVAGLSLLLFTVAIFSAGFDKAFVLLLIGMQAARNFTLLTRRDFYYSYVISLILILYAASLSKDAFFILYIVVYVLAGMFTLMADHIDDTLSRAQGGDREVLIRRMSLPVKGAGLAAAVTALSILLYLVVPRPPSPQVQAFPAGGGWTYNNQDWERQAEKDQHHDPGKPDNPVTSNSSQDLPDDRADTPQGGAPGYGGFQKKFDITKGGTELPDDIVFYLQAGQPLYVRAKTFDLFDGRTWTASRGQGRKIRNEDGFNLDKEFRGYGTGQTFTIELEIPAYILAAYRPVMMWFPGGVIDQEGDYSLRAPGSLRKGTVYSVLSDSEEMNGRPFSSGEKAGNLQKYLQLPDNLSRRVKDLGSAVTQNAQGSLVKAEAIENYLRSNYFYTMSTALHHPDSDVLDEFLFDTKQGHCEYFASSMIIMLRTVNVPARLATGYAAHQENAITGYYEVRQKNAHAWVEAYIEGYGWMTFEPTSSFEIPHGSKRLFAASGVLKYVEDRLSATARSNPGTWWAEAIRRILDFFKRLWRTLLDLFEAIMTAGERIVAWFLELGWIVLLLILASFGIAFPIYKFLEKSSDRIDLDQLRRKDVRQFIIQCYYEMEIALTRRKLPRRPFCSPSEYTPFIAKHLPHLAPSVEVIVGLFNLARYSSIPVGALEADSAFEAYQYIRKSIDAKQGKNTSRREYNRFQR